MRVIPITDPFGVSFISIRSFVLRPAASQISCSRSRASAPSCPFLSSTPVTPKTNYQSLSKRKSQEAIISCRFPLPRVLRLCSKVLPQHHSPISASQLELYSFLTLLLPSCSPSNLFLLIAFENQPPSRLSCLLSCLPNLIVLSHAYSSVHLHLPSLPLTPTIVSNIN